MLFLLELPLLLLLLPSQTAGWPVFLAAYLIGCFFLERYYRTARPRLSLSPKMFFIALPTAFALGESFGRKTSFFWLEELLPGGAGWLSWLLGGLSLVGLLILMSVARSALRLPSPAPAETDLEASSPVAGRRPDRRDTCFCALVALASVASFSCIFPLRANTPGLDQAVFLYMGREMVKGRVPYVDLFDHKGLFFYFLQALGTLLSFPGTYSGVWLLELLNCFVFCLLLYRLAGLVSGSRTVCRSTVFAVAFLSWSWVFDGGNLTEEYALPWLALALLIFLRYFLSGQYRKRDIFFLGLGCGAVAMIRVNMAALWVFLVPLTLLQMLTAKRQREILPCAGLFTLGLAAVCVPVLAYTLATSSLDEMIRYYLLFNMEYSADGAGLRAVFNTMLLLICLFPLGIGAFAASVFYRAGDSRQMRRLHGINFLTFAFSALFASISGRTYVHYAVVLLPMLTPPICNAVQWMYNAAQKMREALPARPAPGAGRRAAQVCACLACGACILLNIADGRSPERSPITGYLLSHTAPEDDVLIIDMGDPYYLETGRSTANKFFYQDPPLIMSDTLYAEFLREFDRKPSDTVLFTDSREVLLNGYGNNLGDFAHQMEQRVESGEYSCEEFDGFYVLTRIK